MDLKDMFPRYDMQGDMLNMFLQLHISVLSAVKGLIIIIIYYFYHSVNSFTETNLLQIETFS